MAAREVRRIGYLSSSSATAAQNSVEVFRQALRALGWDEGQNIVIDYRFAEGRFERNSGMAPRGFESVFESGRRLPRHQRP